MTIFLTACDFDLSQVILDGNMDPTSEKRTWDDKAKKAHALNAKAMSALFCALNQTKYTKVSRCLTFQKKLATSSSYTWRDITSEGIQD